MPRSHIPQFGARVRCGVCDELFELLPDPINGDGAEPNSDSAASNATRMNGLEPGHVARMTVLDILYSDGAAVAKARQEGRVLTALRDELDRAYALYASRVGDELASSTPHFRQAVVSILLKGEEPD